MILLYVPKARSDQLIDLPAGWSVLLESSNDSYGTAVPPLQWECVEWCSEDRKRAISRILSHLRELVGHIFSACRLHLIWFSVRCGCMLLEFQFAPEITNIKGISEKPLPCKIATEKNMCHLSWLKPSWHGREAFIEKYLKVKNKNNLYI